MKLIETEKFKSFSSSEYNYRFRKTDGLFLRWGKTEADDPPWSPFGPEIADIEITTICNGPKLSSGGNKLCEFCYKSNSPNGKYMAFETFKTILDKFPHALSKDKKKIFHLTQIAFGVDAECKSNPDVWKIFAHCRENGIIPNLTVASIDDEVARNIAKYCGACAVSRYSDKDVCYNAVELLTSKHGMSQVNIHQLVAAETLSDIWETLRDIKTDKRLKNLNAIVFLSLKKKGRGVHYHPLSQEEYAKIVDYCFTNEIRFGSDSCGAGKLLKSLSKERYDQVIQVVEPCEASMFSFYCDVNGRYFPCSFMANEEGNWKDGIDMLQVNDFMREIWNAPVTVRFKQKVLKCNRELNGCCHFKI